METRVGSWPAGPGHGAGVTMLEQYGHDFVSRLARELHRTDPRTLDPVLDGTLFDGFDPDDALP